MALLLVLWVFMTLGVIALDFAKYMRDDAAAAMNVVEETRAYYVALAGLNRALFEDQIHRDLENTGSVVDLADLGQFPLAPADNSWHTGTFRGAEFRVRNSPEDGRIPVNCALFERGKRRALLKAVVTNLVRGGNQAEGVGRREDTEIETVVDSILDWTDGDDEAGPNGAESKYYLALRPPYLPKNNRINSAEEMLGIRGLTADLLYGAPGRPGLRDVLTMYGQADGDLVDEECVVNGHFATPAVLQALLGSEQAEGLLAMRYESNAQGDEDLSFQTMLKGAVAQAIPELGEDLIVYGEPSVSSFEAEADLRQDRNHARLQAVVSLGDREGVGNVRVLRWYDRAPWMPADEGTEAAAEDAAS